MATYIVLRFGLRMESAQLPQRRQQLFLKLIKRVCPKQARNEFVFALQPHSANLENDFVDRDDRLNCNWK